LSGFDLWSAERFGENAAPAVAGPLADADHNGVTNLMEYALGVSSNQPSAPVVLPSIQLAAGLLELGFQRIADPLLTYSVEAGDSPAEMLPIWTSSGPQNTAGPVTVQDLPEAAGLTTRFMRLRVNR
jgi:hypothetical protein